MSILMSFGRMDIIWGFMGVIYKVSEPVQAYIIQQKRKLPGLSCRKLAELATDKFKVGISKSAVNKVIKKANLSNPIGRKKRVVSSLQYDVIDCAGSFILANADHELGLTQQICAALFPNVSSRLSRKLLIAFRALVYLPIFGITIDKLMGYNGKALWELAGGKLSLGTLAKFANQKMSDGWQLKISKIVPKWAHYAHFGLFDGSVFYTDGRFQSIWHSPGEIAGESCATDYWTNSYIKDVFQDNRHPIVLLSLGNEISSSTINFILACEASAGKEISRILTFGLKNELARFSYISVNKRYFVAGLFPSQKIRYKITLNSLYQTIKISHSNVDYFIQEGEVVLLQHVVNKEVKLRAGLLKKNENDKNGVIILTNFPFQARTIQEVAQLYLSSWPEPEWSFENMKNASAAVESGGSCLYHNYNNINKLEEIILLTLVNLDYYAKARFFPFAFRDWDLSQMKSIFYSLEGRLKQEQGLIILKLSCQKNFAQIKELDYTMRKLNENQLVWCQNKLFFQIE